MPRWSPMRPEVWDSIRVMLLAGHTSAEVRDALGVKLTQVETVRAREIRARITVAAGLSTGIERSGSVARRVDGMVIAAMIQGYRTLRPIAAHIGRSQKAVWDSMGRLRERCVWEGLPNSHWSVADLEVLAVSLAFDVDAAMR